MPISTYGGVDKTACKRFVTNPDKVNYEKCSDIINHALSENIEKTEIVSIKNDFINDYKTFNTFLKLIRESNLYAIELALKLYPLLEGGNSEDLFGQVSMLIKDHPNLILTTIEKNKIRDINVISKIISSFPIDEFVDKLDKRISETEDRITALKSVNDIELIPLRDQCIAILSNYLKRLNEIKKSLTDTSRGK